MKTNFLTSSMSTTLAAKPSLLATGLLATSLLLSGCSNNDSTQTAAPEDNDEQIVVANSNGPVEEAVAANTQGVVADDNEPVSTDLAADTSMTNDTIRPMATASESPSLVTNPTEPGTPEDTVKQALNTLYYGDAKEAADYYQVDMANFEAELANTQSAFQQTVESVTMTNTQYSVDKTRATITGELKLKGQSEPAPLAYELRKVKGQWKILG